MELRGEFKAAHANGMKALDRHDYDTLGNVISEETQILDEQGALIDAHLKQAAALSREITAHLKTGKIGETGKKR